MSEWGICVTRLNFHFFSIYKGIQALYCTVPLRINWNRLILTQCHQIPTIAVQYWPSRQLHHLVTHSWANWIYFLLTICFLVVQDSSIDDIVSQWKVTFCFRGFREQVWLGNLVVGGDLIYRGADCFGHCCGTFNVFPQFFSSKCTFYIYPLAGEKYSGSKIYFIPLK